MIFLRSLMTDLRERQVLPAVLLLIVLAVAIPVAGTAVFSKSAAPLPVTVPPVDAAPPKGILPPAQELATAQTAPTQKHVAFKGTEQDPFGVPKSSASVSSSPSGSSSSSSSGSATIKPATSTPTSTISPSTSTSTGSGSSISPPTANPSSPGKKSSSGPKPAPSSLASDQVYTVDVSSSYGSQTETLDNVERLTPLPPNLGAEVVFLGVMKGGKSAAFLLTGSVGAQATSTGSTTCEPSKSDCEVIEMPVGAQLTLTPTASAAASGASTFTLKVAAIGAANLASAATATAARQSAASAGEAILTASTSAALASFFYDTKLGALVYEPETGIGTSGSSGSTGTTAGTGSTGSSGTSGSTG
jgi:hypothetical protein